MKKAKAPTEWVTVRDRDGFGEMLQKLTESLSQKYGIRLTRTQTMYKAIEVLAKQEGVTWTRPSP